MLFLLLTLCSLGSGAGKLSPRYAWEQAWERFSSLQTTGGAVSFISLAAWSSGKSK